VLKFVLPWLALLFLVPSYAKSAPAVSKPPLSKKQIAVYEVFLKSYLETEAQPEGSIGLNPETVPLILSKAYGCLRGIDVVNAKAAKTVLHNIGSQFPFPLKSGQPNETWSPIASASGTLILSEIGFDKNERYAVLQYGFYIGLLCVHETTVILKKKTAGRWTRTSRDCGASEEF